MNHKVVEVYPTEAWSVTPQLYNEGQMASSQEQEVVSKIAQLVAEEFEGDYRRAFDYYDQNKDGKVNRGELTALYVDAGIGSRLTRWLYISESIKALDFDKDGEVTYEEFAKKIGQ